MARALFKLLIGTLAIASVAAAQNIQQNYWQAAQLYSNAAAQCPNPAGAACLSKNAAYYQCLGDAMQNNGLSLSSCGAQPTCSTSCIASGSSSSTAASGQPGQQATNNTGSALLGALSLLGTLSNSTGSGTGRVTSATTPSNPFCNDPANKTVGLMLQSMGACGGGSNSAVAKFNAIQNNLLKKQQLINSGGNALFSLMSLFGNNDNSDNPAPATDTDTGPDPAALAALQQQIINADATALLASANSLLPTTSSAATNTPAQPDPNTTLASLLDDSPSNTSTAAVNALLSDSGQQGATDPSVTNALNNLLAENNTPPPATNTPQPGDPLYQPPPATSVPYNGPFADNDITIDWGDSLDKPDPTMFDTLKQNLQSMVQGVEQKVNDALAPLIDQTRQVISYTQQQIAPIVNDPGIQAISQVVSGGGTSMPLTVPTDSAATFDRNVWGQATAGGINLVKGPSGLGTYMNGNVNQINAGLGWAYTQITGANGGALQ